MWARVMPGVSLLLVAEVFGIKLFMAFLHGGEVLVGLLFAGVIVLVGFPLLLYVWLWRTEVSELVLALAYFISVAVLCAAPAFAPNDHTSILPLTTFLISYILTLPWNVLAGWVLSEVGNAGLSDREFEVG